MAHKPDYSLGCQLPAEDWLHLNSRRIWDRPALARFVAPFPPEKLMRATTGVAREREFAHHGAALWQALSEASPIPLAQYPSLLDFGCGCGRLARMFKGFPGRLAGWPAATSTRA